MRVDAWLPRCTTNRYYELTRETLRKADSQNQESSGGDGGAGGGGGGGTGSAGSTGSGSPPLGQDRLVRAEWVNLEEATIFQLELDIMNIEAEIARVQQVCECSSLCARSVGVCAYACVFLL